MKRIIALMLCMLACSGCSALPGEERAFAVALGVSGRAGAWEVCARIPTYQSGGGYATLSSEGDSLEEALARLDAAAPMELHFGQLRMIVFAQELAESAAFPETLRQLAAGDEVRMQAALCVTEAPVVDVMDALAPDTGSRLSKSLEAMLEARQKLGVLPSATLADTQVNGVRRQCVLPDISMADQEGETAKSVGKVRLGGGWLVGQDGRVQGRLQPEEMQLLALLTGGMRQGRLALQGGTVTLTDVRSRVRLQGNTAHCNITLRYTSSALTDQGLQQEMITALQGIAGKLAAAGCDALGLGGQAMTGCASMAEWFALDWPRRYPTLEWRFTVKAGGKA